MQKSRTQLYDELLVIKCQQGDKEAFSELVGRWQQRLLNYAFRVTGSEPAAYDIVQEIWYAVIKGIRKLSDLSVFPGWVFRIANNKCADWLRSNHLQSRLHEQLEMRAHEQPGDSQSSNGNTESLQAAVQGLPPDRRALLELRYHEGFDVPQIAEIMGVPEGTVKSRLHRTLEQLRQIMERFENG